MVVLFEEVGVIRKGAEPRFDDIRASAWGVGKPIAGPSSARFRLYRDVYFGQLPAGLVHEGHNSRMRKFGPGLRSQEQAHELVLSWLRSALAAGVTPD